MPHGNIVANRFMFCAEHGQELCHRCGVDHRLCNTVMIEKELVALLKSRGDDPDFDASDRPSINLFSMSYVPLTSPWDSDDDIPCSQHFKADCKTCFDWVKLVGSVI
ncbi:hypothetical protein DFH28DRAFT_1081122 [Melampsora americana]|nr:hypothetical protein DFH28DRAFT_1081122 [Melampsora americana]